MVQQVYSSQTSVWESVDTVQVCSSVWKSVNTVDVFQCMGV